MVQSGQVTACTKMYCETPTAPKCLEYANTGIDLTNCTSYFDGCNNCMVESGVVTACTMMYCETPTAPKCNQYAETGTETTWTEENTKIILNNYFSKDNEHVYLDWDIIKWLDPKTVKTFGPYSSRYIKDDKNVFRWPKKIEWADAATFEALDNIFSKDKNHVYHNWEIVTEADQVTFESIINDQYRAKDKNYVYDINGKIIQWIDGWSFNLLNNLRYVAKDKNYIYGQARWQNETLHIKKLEWADVSTFQIIWYEYSEYAKDKNNVYYNFKKLEWADQDSIQAIDNNLSYDVFDKNHKYKNWEIVE